MAKILLLDFDDTARDYLSSEKFDVDLKTTGWKSGNADVVEIPGESEIVFYQINPSTSGGDAQLHAGTHRELIRRLEDGAGMVCFIGEGELYQLTNIIGSSDGIELEDKARAESILFNPRALFHIPLERFRPYISTAYKLMPETFDEGVWEKETSPETNVEILAKSAEGSPVALLMRRGRGYVLLLPSFGSKNVQIVEHILKNKMSFAVFEEEAEGDLSWLEKDEYVFPGLKALLTKKEEERRRHEKALAEIEEEIREMRANDQEEFHKLLKAEGEELKNTVFNALKYLGWKNVVDVDSYWKNVIRDKEEDIWLMDIEEQNIEASLSKEPLILLLIRGNKNWATDDECALLQKYKGRRMQEFGNTRMKAVLLGNYYSGTDATSRKNPFSAIQIEEAEKDGNGLLTTYELFKAIKAEKETQVRKDAIRAQLKEKTGLISFELT